MILFFGTATGRCATMTLANALNAEPGVTCTHEGKFRHGERPGDQVLPFLTLENRLAYDAPADAQALFDTARAGMPEAAGRAGGTHFGDIAYNNAPFLAAIAARFPAARVFAVFRDGRDFVRSATVAEGEDPAPVGWPAADKPLTAVERFVALGRLAPRASDPLAARWDTLDAAARNAWLWAETNRLILDGLERFPAPQVQTLRFEDIAADPHGRYRMLRRFLGIDGPVPPAVDRILDTRINRRPRPPTADAGDAALFDELAGPMMDRLGYA